MAWDRGTGQKTFRHGVHPAENKDRTAHRRIERMPFGGHYVLPLGQHIGAPSRPVVAEGDRVERGQRLAEPGGFVSTALHAPVTGRVVAVAPRRHPDGSLVPSVEVEADPFSAQQVRPLPPVDPETADPAAFAQRIQEAGIVGLGGAAFPTHVKYQLPEGRRCRHLVVNGAECEPYLTCDHRIMVERTEGVARGLRIVARRLEAERVSVGIEANKPEAVQALRKVLADDEHVTVVPLRVKYPQGAEKMLIHAITGEVVPAGGLPLDIGMVVSNVGTLAAVADAFDAGTPLVERVLTVSGGGVPEPANLVVPLGIPVREVLRHCGGPSDRTRLVVMGGAMMGMALASLDVPVLKGTSGILALEPDEIRSVGSWDCIRCGRCLEACACNLDPSRLGRLARVERYDRMRDHHLLDCMECAACAWVCPSRIPLVHLFRVAKAELRRREQAELRRRAREEQVGPGGEG